MSYREENGQVILTMDLLDWQVLLIMFGRVLSTLEYEERAAFFSHLTRLNEGNPNFKPYMVYKP